MATPLIDVPLFDARDDGVVAHAVRRLAQARAVRDACLGWLPCGDLLARFGDPLVRRWMGRANTPYCGEIAAIGAELGVPGIWLLHGAYLFGCTALADRCAAGPRLRRTLDWPFPGLGRLLEIVRQRGPAGDYLNVTWPGSVGVLTASAPGRFAASINQAPMKRRTRSPLLLWLDYVLNALDGFRQRGKAPPEHVLRQAFESCVTFDEARGFLESAAVVRPTLFLLVGCTEGERVLIERDGRGARTYRDETVVANAWREAADDWRPRVCGTGPPAADNAARRDALAGWTDRDSDRLDWATAPVVNHHTRLTVEMCPADGSLGVAGWEADGKGGAHPVTAFTRL